MDDLTAGFGEKRNRICHKCGRHHWQGRFWTRAEWEVYVEGNDAEVRDESSPDAAGAV